MKKIITILTLFFLCIVVSPNASAKSNPTLNKKNMSVRVGQSSQLKIRNYKGKIIWNSANCKIATVSNTGKVMGMHTGTTTITAATDKNKYSCKVKVTQIVKQGTCGNKGDNVKWTLDNKGTLILTGVGIASTYMKYGSISPFFSFRSMITRVVIKKGITTIGPYLFAGCDNIKVASFSKTVSNVSNNAFKGCKKLVKVYIYPTLKKVGKGAFKGCKKLKGMVIDGKLLPWKKLYGKLTKSIRNVINSFSNIYSRKGFFKTLQNMSVIEQQHIF